MPNFGPGVDQSLAPAVTPTWVFTPTPGVRSPSVRFYNTGNSQPVYIGGPNVTQFNGLPLYPGSRPIELQVMPTTMYVCSGVTRGAVGGTLGSASTAGTTAVTLAAAVPASLAAGTTIMIGSTVNTSSMEANLVASTTASSQLTFLNPLLYDHANSTVVYVATPNTGSVRVTAGAS